MAIFVTALSLIFASGLSCALARPKPRLALALAVGGAVGGGLLGLWPAFEVLLGAAPLTLSGPWPMVNGAFVVELDPLSAFFVVPVLLLGGAGAVYGAAYLGQSPRGVLGAAVFNLLIASMAMVVVARNAVLFLVAWEAMALTAFVLVAFDHHDSEARRAGWVFLIAAHIGAAALFAMFMLLAKGAGSYDFQAFAAHPPEGARAAVVALLAVVGFGAKAGFFPLHVWLPEAHAASPSHVSALMSGAMIKLGIYGVLRVFLLEGQPAGWWGPLLCVLGLVGALVAISAALYQRDYKRVLAYSSVENVGIIALGLGLAYEAHASGLRAVAALAMAGALLHVWNHTLMKGTMFFAAGSVLHSTHTRDLERLGGLMKLMPLTGLAFATGAVALSALPPLNGFVSEWQIYRALLERGLGGGGPVVLLPFIGAGVLALIGGLTALTFARVWGVMMLGSARTPHALKAHESGRALTFPMLALAALCVAAALAPSLLLRPVAAVGAQLLGVSPATVTGEANVGQFSLINAGLWALVALVFALLGRLTRRRAVVQADTWGCGYTAPSTRMQYGATSFSELVSSQVLPPWLRPPLSRHAPKKLFAERGELGVATSDPLTRQLYEPLFARFAGRLSSFARIQTGALNSYLLYVLVAVVAGLGWLFVRQWVAP